MFTIPYEFSNDGDCYITMPVLKRFAKERKKEDLKTTDDKPQLLENITNYANQSKENEEDVKEWLDSVLVQGIKDVMIKYIDWGMIDPNIFKDEEFVVQKLECVLTDKGNKHLSGRYDAQLKLYRYELIEKNYIKMYFGKLLCTYDKENGSGEIPYPIYVEINIEQGVISARAKSKASIYKYMSDFIYEKADTTSAMKEMNDAIGYACKLFGLNTLKATEANMKFRQNLYYMLDKYTKTPKEIRTLMEEKQGEIFELKDIIMNKICRLSQYYSDDIMFNINNMIEKYFSITYKDKNIFTKDREAYPLKLIATDEEESKVEQTSAIEDPLQSKAIFFDNKKMLQKGKLCDGISFMFNRRNKLYFSEKFKVKIYAKKDFCILKFTEYTMEEDMNYVLFSLIEAKGNNG